MDSAGFVLLTGGGALIGLLPSVADAMRPQQPGHQPIPPSPVQPSHACPQRPVPAAQQSPQR
jgi:hypothetical protein